MVPTHAFFDVAAAFGAATVTILMRPWLERAVPAWHPDRGYAVALVGGAIIGAYFLGTVNLRLSGQAGIGRSILGGLVGSIAVVELYKAFRGIATSTGLIFVPAICTSLVIGRLGCYFTGLSDFTYGTATTVAWAHDFGDGVPRHPVQIYESLAALLFLAVTVASLDEGNDFFQRNGFYLFAGWYGLQRFAWEFLKPYGHLLGPFNLFHFACVALVAYAVVMIGRTEHARARQPA